MKGQNMKNEPMVEAKVDIKEQLSGNVKREPGENNEPLSEEALAE